MKNKIKIGNLYSSKTIDLKVKVIRLDGEYLYYECINIKDTNGRNIGVSMACWVFERDFKKFSFRESFMYHWYRLGLNKSWYWFVPLVVVYAAYIYYNYFNG